MNFNFNFVSLLQIFKKKKCQDLIDLVKQNITTNTATKYEKKKN